MLGNSIYFTFYKQTYLSFSIPITFRTNKVTLKESTKPHTNKKVFSLYKITNSLQCNFVILPTTLLMLQLDIKMKLQT